MKKDQWLVYFDNAATTFPKPVDVIRKVVDVMSRSCGNPGRSGHVLSMRASEVVYECRKKIADEFGGELENVVFVSSATHAINLGIKTALKAGDHVLISDIEHNSVIRPIARLAERGLITYTVYPAYADAERAVAAISDGVRPNTAMLVACHHSNICNIVQPIRRIGELCRKNGMIFLVDAAQSAGALDIDVGRDGIDILCAPGHKGLYGLPGSGFVLFGERYSGDGGALLGTFTEGGNGIRSREMFMPEFLPDRLEAGTLAVPAIGAMSAGLDFVQRRGKNRILSLEKQLYHRLSKGVDAFSDRLTVYGDGSEGAIFLFSVKDIPSEEVAARLDSYGICVRAGLHCAPTAHRKLGTPEDGAVRVSFGAMNTEKEADRFLEVLEKIAFTR